MLGVFSDFSRPLVKLNPDSGQDETMVNFVFADFEDHWSHMNHDHAHDLGWVLDMFLWDTTNKGATFNMSCFGFTSARTQYFLLS